MVAKIIRELKSHMIPYKFKCSHWLKLQHSDWRANLVKDFFLQINFPPMRALEFIRDHVTFKLPYDFSYHMKTPNNQHPLHWIYFVAYLVTISNTLLLLFCRCIVTVPSCLLLGILQHQQSMQQPKALKLITR